RWSPSKAPTVTALVIGPLRLPAPPSPRSRPARSPRPLAPRPGEHQVRASQQPRAAPLALNQLTEPEEPAVRTLEHDRSWSPGERKTSSGPEHRPGCRRDAPAVPDVLGRGSVEPHGGEHGERLRDRDASPVPYALRRETLEFAPLERALESERLAPQPPQRLERRARAEPRAQIVGEGSD